MEDIKQREGRPKRLSENSISRVNHHSRVKYTHMGNRTHKDNLMKTFKQLIGKELPIVDEEEQIDELGPAAMARRKRMRARMGVLQKKYGDARKAGIHPSRVSQRHNKMTVKKR